jgi:hypothetical protein
MVQGRLCAVKGSTQLLKKGRYLAYNLLLVKSVANACFGSNNESNDWHWLYQLFIFKIKTLFRIAAYQFLENDNRKDLMLGH